MPDSLLFDGFDDYVRHTIGNMNGIDGGPVTIAAIIKRSAAGGFDWFFGATDNGGITAYPSIIENTGALAYLNTDDGRASTFTIDPSDNWIVVAITKAGGSSVVRFHKYVYDTSTWTHENVGAGMTDGSACPSDGYLQAGRLVGLGAMTGNILVSGIWSSVLSDGTLEGMDLTLQSWIDAGPVELFRYDTMSAVDSLTGTSTEDSRTGTTLDTGDAPAGWDDTLGAAPIVYSLSGPDFTRNMFPFIPMGDTWVQGRGRPSTQKKRGPGPSPMGGFERYIFPRLHPIIILTGVTYAKDGSLITATFLAGDDASTFVEAGSLTVDTELSGGRVMTWNRAGALTPDTTVAGADVAEHPETGSLIAGTSLSGADVFNANETGALTPDTTLSGADATQFTEAGSLTPDTEVSAADAATLNRLGAITPDTTVSGADVFNANETGSLTPFVLNSGVSQSGGYAKTGSLTTLVFLAGGDASSFAEAGSLTPSAFVSGLDATTHARLGSLAAMTNVTGSDAYTAVEIGSVIAGVLISGLASVTSDTGPTHSYFFGPPRPRGRMDAGTPAALVYAGGTPGGDMDAGTPDGDFYDPPTPGRG